ncbi:MAG: hypothetical protein FWB77_05895 [Treponema sp.]|nr:hypothetical protein [Treponema sp.]
MIRSLCLISVLFVFAANICLEAQEQHISGPGIGQGFRGRSLVLDINARVLENEKEVIWDQSHKKITIPGNPVSVQLAGSNVVVSAQFTPFIRRGGNVMVIQGQIWIEDPKRGISYYTSIQTVPMEFNEPIHYFPLGTDHQSNASIEIILTVNRYREPKETAEEKAAGANGE